MVTAAMAGGYAIVYMLQVPPQGNHVIRVPELTERQWVDKLLSDDSRCFESCRMRLENLIRLHNILRDCYGLKGTRKVESIEALAMFLWTCGTNQCQRQMHERFRRGLGTCSKVFAHVLTCMTRLTNDILRPRDYTYSVVSLELLEYAPFFDGCIGALDGTHIGVIVDHAVHEEA